MSKIFNKNNTHYIRKTTSFFGTETISVYKKLPLGQIRVVELIYNESNLEFLISKYNF